MDLPSSLSVWNTLVMSAPCHPCTIADSIRRQLDGKRAMSPALLAFSLGYEPRPFS
ncbi:hypothetical protein B0O80DRAFT_445981 [Mortierella sp. GBAus27b]|nr:hypothetical protein B0O80DRAFT_445981 [Mortierella sp. GBAus27b]